jgi:hypothetical protein
VATDLLREYVNEEPSHAIASTNPSLPTPTLRIYRGKAG